MRSPTTTTRVMMPPPCCLQIATGHGKTNSFRAARVADLGDRAIVDAQALPNGSRCPDTGSRVYAQMRGGSVPRSLGGGRRPGGRRHRACAPDQTLGRRPAALLLLPPVGRI